MTITIDSNTPRKEITIKDEVFVIPVPYTEGHVLSENEANALNQTYAENLRNNFAGVVTAAKKAAELLAEGKEGGAEYNREDLQSQLNAYIAEYEFGARRQAAAAVDPVTKIAINIAKDLVKKALVKQGKAVKDFSADQIAEMAKGVVEKYPHIRASAQKQHDLKKEAASTVLEDLAA